MLPRLKFTWLNSMDGPVLGGRSGEVLMYLFAVESLVKKIILPLFVQLTDESQQKACLDFHAFHRQIFQPYIHHC